MTLIDVLDAKNCKLDLTSKDKDGVLEELVSIYSKNEKIKEEDKKEIISMIKQREKAAPTIIGEGIALPHTRLESLKKPAVIIGYSKDGIEFAPGENVRLFIMVLTPANNPAGHLQLLSSIAKLCTRENLIEEASKSKTDRDLFSVFLG